MKYAKIVIWMGMLLVLLFVVFILDYSYITRRKTIRVPYLEEILEIRYFEGSKDIGIMAFGGLSSDQTTMINFVHAALNEGFHAMTFDHVGHGGSSGALKPDWAEMEMLADETAHMIDVFKELSGLEDDQIVLVGHSMGGRAILQIIAESGRTFKGVHLIAPYLDLKQDSPDWNHPWVIGLDETTLESTPFLITTGGLDDHINQTEVSLLFERLTNTTVPAGDVRAQDGNRKMEIHPFLTHNYEVLSVRTINAFSMWAEPLLATTIPTTSALVRIIMIPSSTFLLILVLLETRKKFKRTPFVCSQPFLDKTEHARLKRTHLGLTLPIALGAILVLFLFEAPLFSLLLACLWFGYGFAGVMLYHKRTLLVESREKTVRGFVMGIGMFLGVMLITLFINARGIGSVVSLNGRFAWLIVFIGMTAFFYPVVKSDECILASNNSTSFSKGRMMLVHHMPLVLMMLLSLMLFITTGIAISLQVFVVAFLAKLLADNVFELSKNIVLASLSYACLFPSLLIMYSVAIRLF